MHKYIYKITTIAVLTAMSFILSYIKIPLTFLFPSFLEINFTFLPIIIAYYLVGFKESLIVNLVRIPVKILIIGTSSMYMGELCDFLIASSILTSLYIVNRKTEKPLWHLLTGVISWTVSGVLLNLAIILPSYMVLMNISKEAFVTFMPEFLHTTVDNFYFIYIFAAVLPFNIIISCIVIPLGYFIAMPLEKITFIKENKTRVYKEKEKNKE